MEYRSSLQTPLRRSSTPDRVFGLGVAVRVAGKVSVRASFERDWFPYDRARFSESLGLSAVDLNDQLGAGAQTSTWSVGPELSLWRSPSLDLYSFGTLGRVSRAPSTGPLLALYCGAPSVVIDADGGILAPSDWVAPAACDRALAETRVAGSGVSFEVGAGLRLRHRHGTYFSLEGGYARSFLVPYTDSFPLRIAYGLHVLTVPKAEQ